MTKYKNIKKKLSFNIKHKIHKKRKINICEFWFQVEILSNQTYFLLNIVSPFGSHEVVYSKDVCLL